MYAQSPVAPVMASRLAPHPSLSRAVHLLSGRKRGLFWIATTAGLWWLPLPVWALAMACFWVYQFRAFRRAQALYRSRDITFVVYAPNTVAQRAAAETVAADVRRNARPGETVDVSSSQDFDPWRLLVRTCSLVLVGDGFTDAVTDRFVDWCECEKYARVSMSRAVGFVENIGQQGHRVGVYARLAYDPHSVHGRRSAAQGM